MRTLIFLNMKGGVGKTTSSLSLAEAEKKLVLNSNIPQHNRLSKIIDQTKKHKRYDYVIIDCPPILNTLTINAVLAATDIIIPIHPDRFAVDGFSITLKNIQELQENLNVTEK